MTILDFNSNLDVGQNGISSQRRLPVDEMGTHTVSTVAAEALTFNYYDANGALQTDAGQAAGTIVVINLANKNVLNELGDMVGNYGDSSFAFVTGTILTNKKPFRGLLAQKVERDGMVSLLTGTERAQAVTDGFSNGEWCLDHEHGVVYGVKATTGSADTANYKVFTIVSGGSSTLPSTVDAQLEYNATPPTLSDTAKDMLQGDVNANLKTTMATGLNSTDDSVEAQVAASSTATGADPVILDAVTNVAQNISAGPCNAYKARIVNLDPTNIAYLLFYNTAAGSVTVGTTAPVDFIPVPAGGIVIDDIATPESFATRMSCAVVVTDHTGNTAPSAACPVSIHIKE